MNNCQPLANGKDAKSIEWSYGTYPDKPVTDNVNKNGGAPVYIYQNREEMDENEYSLSSDTGFSLLQMNGIVRLTPTPVHYR